MCASNSPHIVALLPCVRRHCCSIISCKKCWMIQAAAADEKVPPSVVPPTHDTSLRQRPQKKVRQNGPRSSYKARMSQTNPSRLAAAYLLLSTLSSQSKCTVRNPILIYLPNTFWLKSRRHNHIWSLILQLVVTSSSTIIGSTNSRGSPQLARCFLRLRF